MSKRYVVKMTRSNFPDTFVKSPGNGTTAVVCGQLLRDATIFDSFSDACRCLATCARQFQHDLWVIKSVIEKKELVARLVKLSDIGPGESLTIVPSAQTFVLYRQHGAATAPVYYMGRDRHVTIDISKSAQFNLHNAIVRLRRPVESVNDSNYWQLGIIVRNEQRTIIVSDEI
jgi:hypothetical protein